MGKDTLSNLTDDELRGKLKTFKALQATTTGIFVVIILVWIVLGYWKSNVPVFISTLVVAIGTTASQFAMASGLRSELKKREDTSR